MEGEWRGAVITCHTGAFHVARWTGDLPFGGRHCRDGGKERGAGKKERGWWRLTGGAGSAVREKGKTRAGVR